MVVLSQYPQNARYSEQSTSISATYNVTNPFNDFKLLFYSSLGAKATALERRGIRTEKGNINREIIRRNKERAALKEAKRMKVQQLREVRQMLDNIIESTEFDADIDAATVPNELITKLKTAKRMNEAQENPNAPDKTPSVPNKVPAEQLNVLKRAKNMKKQRAQQTVESNEIRKMQIELDDRYREVWIKDLFVEEMGEHAKNFKTLREHLEQMQIKRQRTFFWQRKRKAQYDRIIEGLEGDLRVALYNFKKNYHVTPEEVAIEAKRIKEEVKEIKIDIEKKTEEISKRSEKLEAMRKEYRAQEFMVKIPSKHIAPEFPARDPKTGRQSATALLDYLRTKDTVEMGRRKEQRAIKAIKPPKVLMITSAEQKKRKIVEVIGEKAYRANKPTRLSVPPRRKKNKTRTIGRSR